MTLRLTIRLHHDRRREGELDLAETGDAGGLVLLRAVPCLAKADNARALAARNGNRDPRRPYGDTPTGTYRAAFVETHDPAHGRMGRLSIPLVGISGDALLAMAERDGLAVHAGRGDDQLFATFGCVRLYDRHMDVLAAKVAGRRIDEIVIDEGLEEA